MLDSYVNICLKQLQNNQLNFEVKIAPIFNLTFYYVTISKFLDLQFWMKCLYILNIYLPQFFLCVCYFCCSCCSKYTETIWTSLYCTSENFVIQYHLGCFVISYPNQLKKCDITKQFENHCVDVIGVPPKIDSFAIRFGGRKIIFLSFCRRIASTFLFSQQRQRCVQNLHF